MNDSFGPGFDTTNAEVKAEGKSEGVLSVFISQIKACPEEGMKLFGKIYGTICIVGLVENAEHTSTKVTYTIQDDTDKITAHLWIDDGEQMPRDGPTVGNYARIFGSVRTQGTEKVIMIFKIQAINSLDEITTHNLEALLCRYQAERLLKKTEQDITGANYNFSNSGSNAAATANTFGLTGKHLLIYQAVKAYNQPDGIPRQVLNSKFAHIPAHEFQTIMDFLFQEGHIFTSIDADHFLSTE